VIRDAPFLGFIPVAQQEMMGWDGRKPARKTSKDARAPKIRNILLGYYKIGLYVFWSDDLPCHSLDHDHGRLSQRWHHHTIDALNTQSLNHDLDSII
jgi:hypothetical protein